MEEEKDEGGSSRGTADTADESEAAEGTEDDKADEEKMEEDPTSDATSKPEREGQCYW